MTEPLDLEPIKALLERRREELMTGGLPIFPILDVAALIQEVERLRDERDRERQFVREVYGCNLTSDPDQASLHVKVPFILRPEA